MQLFDFCDFFSVIILPKYQIQFPWSIILFVTLLIVERIEMTIEQNCIE